MDRPDRRIVPMSYWAPAQEAMFPGAYPVDSTTIGPSEPVSLFAAPGPSRARSKSVSPPWGGAYSSFVEGGEGANRNLGKEHQTSHGSSHRNNNAQASPVQPRPAHGRHSFSRILRRASVSLASGWKGFVHRRPSVPAADVFDQDDQQQALPLADPPQNFARPKTSHSTWQRLRKATSFHRLSRNLHTGYGERAFDADLIPIESPTFPVPGSGEQPPIIPRNTGAAARQAAASACIGLQGYDCAAAPFPRPGLLGEDGLDDRESGIGIALTSSEMDTFVPQDGIDSDLDDGVVPADDGIEIIKVDFLARLPYELATQVLSMLDAATLAKVNLVSRRWAQLMDNYVWRQSFMREKAQTYATGRLVTPGAGLGIPAVLPSNDWKEIYRARQELDNNWRTSRQRSIFLHGHSDSIYCLQFDESKIITGSRDKTIRVWDMRTYACILVIGPPEVVADTRVTEYNGYSVPAHFATVAPDDHRDPGPNYERRYHESMPDLYSPEIHHKASILCLQYDDRILVTGSSDSTCIVHDLQVGYRPIRRLEHHSGPVLDLVFDAKYIVSCSKDHSICVWDRPTGKLVKQLRGHSGPVNAIQMRGNAIVSCSGDFRLKLWNIETGKTIREFLGHSKGLACSQFTEDGRYVVSAGNDKVIRVWDANSGECVRAWKAHSKLVRSLHVDSVSGRLVSASYDSDIKVWDLETGRQCMHFEHWHHSWVLSAKSDYRRIVSSGQEPKILVTDFGADVEGIERLESGLGIPAVPKQEELSQWSKRMSVERLADEFAELRTKLLGEGGGSLA